MKKHLLLFLIAFLNLNAYAQITFEKGYFINPANNKNECFIKNINWKNNTTEKEYKLSLKGESAIGTINNMIEFGIYNDSKYIREVAQIERSNDNLKYLDGNKQPKFSEEQVFLKILVEGKATLYTYYDSNLKRYFYSVDNSKIEPLVYKRYMVTEKKMGKNNHFRQQLFNDLQCSSFKKNTIANLNYELKPLSKLFIEYNQCMNADFENYEPTSDYNFLNFTLRPRFNSSALAIENVETNLNFDFENKNSFGLGVEIEYIFPFNKNKWSIAVEPTYQSYKNSKTTSDYNISGGELTAKVDYSSIEIPITFRHYLFLNNKSKIFLNASYVLTTQPESAIRLIRTDGSTYATYDIESQNTFAFGLGYNFKNKYNLEIRYLKKRNILNSYSYLRADYQTFSVIFGYTIF